MNTLTRRRLLALSGVSVVALALSRWAPAAHAQEATEATEFVKRFGDRLVTVVDSNASDAEKQRELRPLIDAAVDVDAIALFCLGRFATSASPEQLAEYKSLFHSVLVNNITAKIGEYRGVTFRLTTSAQRGADAFVGTVVQRPNSGPVNVRWVVSGASGAMRIVDVVAEGTSLRLTQRSDYASYLGRNGASIADLIGAMQRQVAAASG